MSSQIKFLEDRLNGILSSNDDYSAIVVSKEPQLLRNLNWPANTVWLDKIDKPDCLDISVRSDLGVIFKQFDHMPSDLAMPLLARLRDCHCDELLVHSGGKSLTTREMLALGFTRATSSESGGWFHYQREEFYEERTWNSPDQWAHPQNYKRFRW